jgi:translation initiation factor 2B subunit (eIF-2B alpha/beta/delta family)
VLVVDARPSHTGEAACSQLLQAGVPCSYLSLNTVSHAMKNVSKVMVGAAAVKSNGAVIARSGTALVAMAAAREHKPVLICAQSIKFHDDVQLDSITSNEQADPLVSSALMTCPLSVFARVAAQAASWCLSDLSLVAPKLELVIARREDIRVNEHAVQSVLQQNVVLTHGPCLRHWTAALLLRSGVPEYETAASSGRWKILLPLSWADFL